MNKNMIAEIAGAAMEGMLFEVSAAPKPGLVTPFCSGAHKDMDYFTFLSSASALHVCFDEMVALGMQYCERNIKSLLPSLRQCGVKHERMMFSFTNGVNTHKGMIFTLGILCGCAGWNYGKQSFSYEQICSLAAELCAGICERELEGLNEREFLTKGEQIYVTYGLTGARGEVESGYQTIRNISMPVYMELRAKSVAINDALVQTLLHLIAETRDTNIISRHDLKMSDYARSYAAKVLSLGGVFTDAGKTCLTLMEREFITKNISPGGCADLLAATHFLYKIEHIDID